MAEYGVMTRHLNGLKKLMNSVEIALREGRKILSVFDLDSTLFDVSPRIQRILDELQEHPELHKRYPELIPLLKDVKTHRSDWGIKAALSRVFQNNPPPVSFQNAARDFWARHFFTNEYLQYDHLVEGAVEFVNNLLNQGSDIAYLTGRDWQRMGPGTVEILKKWNFPTPNESSVKLAMKAEKGGDDSLFKSGWFEELKPHNYHRILFFENEPVILHEVMKNHPDIEVIFLETTHSGRMEPHKNWMKITDFRLE